MGTEQEKPGQRGVANRQESPRRRSGCVIFILVIVVIAAAGLGIHYLKVADHHLRMQKAIASANIYRPKPTTPVTESCREAGEIIAEGLNIYFRMHGEYPENLVGDFRTPLGGAYTGQPGAVPEWYCGLIKGWNPLWTEGVVTHADYPSKDYWCPVIPRFVSDEPDPLLESSCLVGYPIYSAGVKYPPRFYHYRSDGFKYGWRCAYTKPWTKLLTSPEEREVSGRLFDAHGSGHADESGQWLGTYKLVSQVRGDGVPGGINTPAFGYQAGQFMGMDESACCLWMYHPPAVNTITELYGPRSRELCGLDAVSCYCEPVPDGIPDGICWFFKLQNGEVVEVVQATDIECE